MQKILDFCIEPKSLSDILEFLGLKDRENLMDNYLNPLTNDGKLRMTDPDNPTNRKQQYIAVKKDI